MRIYLNKSKISSAADLIGTLKLNISILYAATNNAAKPDYIAI